MAFSCCRIGREIFTTGLILSERGYPIVPVIQKSVSALSSIPASLHSKNIAVCNFYLHTRYKIIQYWHLVGDPTVLSDMNFSKFNCYLSLQCNDTIFAVNPCSLLFPIYSFTGCNGLQALWLCNIVFRCEPWEQMFRHQNQSLDTHYLFLVMQLIQNSSFIWASTDVFICFALRLNNHRIKPKMLCFSGTPPITCFSKYLGTSIIAYIIIARDSWFTLYIFFAFCYRL